MNPTKRPGGGARRPVTELYGAAFRGLLYPTWEGVVRRRPTLLHKRLLDEMQRRPLGEIRAHQLRELRALLRHAHEHVPFYRRRMEAAGLAPDAVQDLSDLRRLPIWGRGEPDATVEARSSLAPPLPEIRKVTGGTTGEPLCFGYDQGSEAWRQAMRLRGWAWAGYRPGAPVFYYWGVLPRDLSKPARAKIALDRYIRREHYESCMRRDEASLDRAVTALREHAPEVIVCYTQAGGDLARHVSERGARDWGDTPVICCGEPLSPRDRDAMGAAFGPVFESYGCREVMLIGMECEAHDGMHLSLENLIVEVVVREGGAERPARPGERGEVVLTDLHNYGMPFIRYAVGDYAIAGDEAPCACGRTLPRIHAIDGRVLEALRDRGGARIDGMLFNLLFSVAGETVKYWQAVQHKDLSITLRLVPTAALDEAALAHIRRSLEGNLPGLPLRIERVKDIPLTQSGKRRRIIVER